MLYYIYTVYLQIIDTFYKLLNNYAIHIFDIAWSWIYPFWVPMAGCGLSTVLFYDCPLTSKMRWIGDPFAFQITCLLEGIICRGGSQLLKQNPGF